MKREISSERESDRPVRSARALRDDVEPGSIPYSPVTQPLPEFMSHGGTPSSTHAVHSTLVLPYATRTEPAGWSLKWRWNVMGRSSSLPRPSERMGGECKGTRVGALAFGPREGGL